MAKSSAQWVARMSAEERLAAADTKIQRMLDLCIELVHLHECNKIVAYENRLKGQIPRSFAGVSYRVFSKALVQRELIGVCTLWDSVREDRNSIPTVCTLLDSEDVRDEVLDRKRKAALMGRHLSAQGDDPELLAWVTAVSDRDNEERAVQRANLLPSVVERARELERSDIMKAARDFRDLHLAHNLADSAKKSPELSARYGDEGRLLEASIPILQDLNLVARSSSYDWSGTWRIARRNAEALWYGCTFEVLE